MKKFIKVVMLISGSASLEVDIESIDGLHELDIYCMLEKMFPRYIFVNTNVDNEIYQEGYNIEYRKELRAVAIYRG